MTSPVSSLEDDLNSAYANIILIADKTWAYDQNDSFRKVNRSLWIEICKLSVEYSENESSQVTRRVRDVIPGSRLALYGNFEYDEERERSYKSMENFRIEHRVLPRRFGVLEPWMLQEVEECFTRLSGQISAPTYNEQNGSFTPDEHAYKILKTACEPSISYAPSYVDYDKVVPLRYTIDNLEEMELQFRITSDMVRNLWKKMPNQETSSYPTHQVQPQLLMQHPELIHLQFSQKPQKLQNNQEFRFYNYQNQPTFIKVGHYIPAANQAIGIIRGPPLPILSPKVPEYYPKRYATFNEYDERGVPLQFFPSSSEACYQEEMYPYNRRQAASVGPAFQGASIPILPHPAINTIIQPHQWFHRLGLPLQLQVPVCTPPQAMCATIQPICPTVLQRPIQLNEKAVPPNHANQTPIPVYQRPPDLYQDYPQRRKNQGVDFNNLIPLTKSAMKTKKTQSKLAQINSNIIHLKSNSDIIWPDKRKEEYTGDYYSEFPNIENKCFCLKTKRTKKESFYKFEKGVVNKVEINKAPKRRLYRDVLTNSTSTTSNDCEVKNLFEKTYDDLERQAMEQYRASEECLAFRYQELERQALEQHSNSENSSSTDFLKIDFVETDHSKGSYNQSLFSENNRVNEASSTIKRGVLHQSKITISKPERRFESSNLHHYCYHTNIRSGVIAKSLTTLSHNITKDWKHTYEGASGDVIDEIRPLNQQQMLMSALEKRTRKSFRNGSDLKSCTSSIPTLCNMPTMVQIGGGDEKITYQTSPGSLQTQLFLPNEELTSSSSISVGFNHTFSSQQKDKLFSELDFQLKNQNELHILSSERRLLTLASGFENLTERHFSLKIKHHLNQLSQGSSSDENEVDESLECCLKRLMWICISSDPTVFPTFENSYLDHFKLEIAMLKNWVESKEEETNSTLETVNLFGRNRSYERITREYFKSLPNLLKRACAILIKIKNHFYVNFEMPWLQFLQWEEYHNEENTSADNFVDYSVLEEIDSNRSDKI